MNNTANKKDFFYIVILILTFIVVIIGATIAAFYFLNRQKEGSSSVYTGTLGIEYLSGEIIDFHLLYPTLEPSYEDTDNVYKNNFRVTNTGSLDSIITVSVDVNNNDFTDGVIFYKLFNGSGEELIKGNLNGEGKLEIANNIVLEHESVTEFTLMIWINETGVLQNEEMRKSLTGTIIVDANQKID